MNQIIHEIKCWLLQRLVCNRLGHWWYTPWDVHLYGVDYCRWCHTARGQLKVKP